MPPRLESALRPAVSPGHPEPAVAVGDPRRWVRFLAAASLLVIGARISLPQGFEGGYVVAILLLPVWLPVVRHYRWGWALLASGLLAAVMGVWLTIFNASDHATDTTLMVSNTALLVGVLLSIGVVLWARRVLPEANVTLWFGIGIALSVTPSATLYSTNPWKFGYAVSVSVILLSLAYKSGRRWLQLGVLGALIVTSGLNDSRSAFGILLLSAIIVAFQVIPRPKNATFAALRMVGALAGLGVAIYNLGQSLILDGYLGASTQARSLQQLETSGSLILGGRPELSASVALFRDQWWGFGSGAVPSLNDISVAKAGLASINYAPDNGYVERYMFGGHYEVHSIVGDLWAHFGIAGLVFLLIVIIMIVWGVAVRIAERRASGVIMYAAVMTLWSIGFSPFYSAAPLFVMIVGMLAIPKALHHNHDATDSWNRELSKTSRRTPWPVTPRTGR